MSNILTHNTNLAGGTVQAYATSGDEIVLDLNSTIQTTSQRPVLRLSTWEARALSAILDAARSDASSGMYRRGGAA